VDLDTEGGELSDMQKMVVANVLEVVMQAHPVMEEDVQAQELKLLGSTGVGIGTIVGCTFIVHMASKYL